MADQSTNPGIDHRQEAAAYVIRTEGKSGGMVEVHVRGQKPGVPHVAEDALIFVMDITTNFVPTWRHVSSSGSCGPVIDPAVLDEAMHLLEGMITTAPETYLTIIRDAAELEIEHLDSLGQHAPLASSRFADTIYDDPRERREALCAMSDALAPPSALPAASTPGPGAPDGLDPQVFKDRLAAARDEAISASVRFAIFGPQPDLLRRRALFLAHLGAIDGDGEYVLCEVEAVRDGTIQARVIQPEGSICFDQAIGRAFTGEVPFGNPSAALNARIVYTGDFAPIEFDDRMDERNRDLLVAHAIKSMRAEDAHLKEFH